MVEPSTKLARYDDPDFSHRMVAESLNSHAESLFALGRAREGVPLALHAAEIGRSTLGRSHPAYTRALGALASCYHAVGRSHDARECLEECPGMREAASRRDRADMIPNLMGYGGVLRSTGDLEGARAAYRRAIAIHTRSFEGGQEASQLDRCRAEADDLTARIEGLESPPASTSSTVSYNALSSKLPPTTATDIDSNGTPVVVFTDIGRDVDDEMAMVLLSTLRNKRLLNPIAVITTLSPQRDRARLARGSLDTLGMADVPVGVGGRGGVAEGVELEVYDAAHTRPSASIHESGVELARRALESVPPKSAQILCLASLSDMALLIRRHQDLFESRVREVVVMGGVNPVNSGDTLTPDTAYNNNCDLPAANFVYQKCQELGVPTMTLSRWAAYGCPIRPRLLDELAKTEHMVAVNIRTRSKDAIDRLWNKVIHPPGHPGREKLPARCDVGWFFKTFCDEGEAPRELGPSIWTRVQRLNMYDPLAVLACVPSYRELHFACETKTVNGVVHAVVGTCENDTGIRDAMSLYKEYSHLFVVALRSALHKPEMPLGCEKEPEIDVLIEETAKILNSRSRAA